MLAQLLSLTFASQLVFLVVALPDGAPENEMVCIEMTPDHGDNEPQTTEAPYSMILSQNTYLPGDIIQRQGF